MKKSTAGIHQRSMYWYQWLPSHPVMYPEATLWTRLQDRKDQLRYHITLKGISEFLSVRIKVITIPIRMEYGSTYIHGSIYYLLYAGCHHKSYELWDINQALLLDSVKPQTMLERINYLEEESHDREIYKWHECCLGDNRCISHKWMIMFHIHSTTRWVFIHPWGDKFVGQMMTNKILVINDTIHH